LQPKEPNPAPSNEKNIDDLNLETYMSDFLNVKDIDLAQAIPSPELL
jgi:hypothetical protein